MSDGLERIDEWTRFDMWAERHRSAVVVFATELEALRHAVELSMQVEFRQFGVDLFRGER